MKEHANVPREDFDIRWVDTGLRVSVTPPPGRLALPIALASFTLGANWALNFDRCRELAPQMDPEVVDARHRHGGLFSVALLHHQSRQRTR